MPQNIARFFYTLLLPLIVLVRALIRSAAWLLNSLFGHIAWQPPGWARFTARQIQRLSTWSKQHPKMAVRYALALVLLTAGGIFGWHYYQSQPKPVMTTFEIDPPGASTYDERGKPYPYPLIVRFSESVASVDNMNATITQGISMQPALAGVWTWDDDRTLRFSPKTDWPVGQDFKVSMDRKVLMAPQVRLQNDTFKFASAPFSAIITSASFYQDPVDPNLKKLVATVQFSHPADIEQFKKQVEIKLGGGLGFLGLSSNADTTISFDKLNLNAYVHSAPLAIPKEDTQLSLRIKRGIRASKGGSATREDLLSEVTIPGLYSLRIERVEMSLVDNERFEPEQVLMVASSMPVSEAALKGKVSAWLLPEFHPKTPEAKRTQPYSWRNDEVTREILADAAPVSLEMLPSAEDQESMHGYKFKAPVGRQLYVKIDAGIQAFGGYLSQQPALSVVNVIPYPKSVKLLSQGALLSLTGDKRLAFMSRGVNGVHIEIGRVLPNQLHHLVQKNYGAFASPGLYDSDLDTLVERLHEKRPLPVSEYGKPTYDSIDFGHYLKERSSYSGGVFMVRLQSYDPEHPQRYPDTDPDTRFVLVTDIGIIAKRAVDGSQDVFVQSISTGRPIVGAQVEVIGRNGLPVLSQLTDHQGHARFEKLTDLRREKEPLMYIVSKDNDQSFLPINRGDRNLNLSRFDIGGIDNAASAQQLNAFGFTDRGIYRPGETVHIGLITRTADWQGSLQGVPLEVEITDPRGMPVMKKTYPLDASGFITLDYKSRETSATGEYQVGLYVINQQQWRESIGGTSFKVRDFEPDRLKVQVALADQSIAGWISPEQAQASVRAMHLFGSPANGRRVEAEMTLSPAIPAFAQYRDFSFQERYRLKEPYTEKLAPAETNSDGIAELDMNLKRFARASYRLHIGARVFESGGGRGVAGESAALVSSAPYLVGIKADGQRSHIPRDAERYSEWLAIDPALQPLAVDGLKQLLIERRYVSVLVKQDNGTYKYESRKKEIIRSSTPLSLTAGVNTLPLNTSEPGDFALALRDAEGNELNRVEYSVAGQANLTRSLERNAELQLTLDKTDYKPGEQISVNIRAPYTGAGLITIERDRVYHHQWFKAETTSSVHRIPLPADFEGNGYISVQFVRDATSDEIFMSPLSYGVIPFRVDLDARREPIKVAIPAVIKPGETLKMGISSPHATKAVVFAVDEGILQVARYTTPDPVGHFFQKRALQVRTTQILDLILPEFQQLMLTAAPGGDGDAVLGRHLNPFKKKGQQPVAFWSGMINLDAQGKTLEYQVPENFNGKLRVFALAVNPQRIGVFDGGTEVRGDLILSANVPAMIAPGDEFNVSVSVFNNIAGADSKTPVSLTVLPSSGLSLISDKEQRLQIAPQQESTVTYRLRAEEKLGSASLRFTASSGKSSRTVTGLANERVSIRPASAFSSHIQVGKFDSKQLSLPLTRQLYSEKREVSTGIAYSPLVWSHGLKSFFDNYAYSCTEQLVSRGVPALVMPDDHKTNFEQVIETLRERQNSDGSFGQWSANLMPNPFISTYATHYLLEAREHGLPVPDDILSSANQWLSQLATGGSQGLDGARTRAYAIYLLTRQGMITSGMLATLQKELDERYAKAWPQDLIAAYMAASYQLLQQDQLADNIMKAVPWLAGKTDVTSEDPYYDATVHDAQRLYLIARHFRQHLKQVPDKAIRALGDAIGEDRYHTLSAAYMMLAFEAYGHANGKDHDNLAIVSLNKAGKKLALKLHPGPVRYGQVPADSTQLLFQQPETATAFYMLSENGFDRTPPAGPMSDGLEIAKMLTDINGQPLKQIQVGDEFLIKLSFRSTRRDRLLQVAIVDLLPGGMEPVLRKQSDAAVSMQNGDWHEEAPIWQSPIGEPGNRWQPNYVDVRDDRVILYGTLSRDMGQFVYRVRATNVGKFALPAPFAEGMYNRRLKALGKQSVIEVEPASSP